jgi:hypothetical protein
MKDELVIESLIDLYKEKGIDLHILLDDPLFQSLKLDSKVSLIKKYASHISSSTSRSLNKADIRALITNTLIMSGLGALSSVVGRATFNASTGKPMFSMSAKPMAIAAGIGAAIGAGKTLMDARDSISQRKDSNRYLDKVISSGDDKDALKFLMLRSLHSGKINTGNTASMLNSMGENLSKSLPGVGMAAGEYLGGQAGFKDFKAFDHAQDYADNHYPNGVEWKKFKENNDRILNEHLEASAKSRNAIIEKLKGNF